MYKSSFPNLLKSFLNQDPSLAIEKDDEQKLTPAQGAIAGLHEALQGADINAGSGYNRGQATMGDSLTHSPEQEGYDQPITGQVQDISIGTENLTPRTGMTLDRVPRNFGTENPVTATTGSSMGTGNSVDDALVQKQQALIDAQNQPIQKQSKWKDVGAYLIQGLNAGLNPNPNNKIVGYGRIKHDNAVRDAEMDLQPIQRQKDWQTQNAFKQAQVGTELEQGANYRNQSVNRNTQTLLDIDEATRKQLNDEQSNILKVWADLDTYDETRPEYKALAERAKRAGVQLVNKDRGQKYSTQIAPDGRIVVTNTSTGQYNIGKENLSKPVSLSDDDLPDDMFPWFKSDKDIETASKASVGELPASRRVRPDVLANLPANLKNPDGTLNESAYWAKVNEGAYSKKEYEDGTVSEKGTNISPNELYENLPANTTQKIAQAANQRRLANKPAAEALSRFKTAVKNNRPSENASPVPLLKVVDLFNAIMAKPLKERTGLLKKFYDNLPNMRVQ